jgi:hypothetical protein
LGNHSAANIRDAEILKKWRNAIQHAVSEGESYAKYSEACSPVNKVKTYSDKLAIRLVAFKLVDICKVQLPLTKLTKEEKMRQHTEDIIGLTKISESNLPSLL